MMSPGAASTGTGEPSGAAAGPAETGTTETCAAEANAGASSARTVATAETRRCMAGRAARKRLTGETTGQEDRQSRARAGRETGRVKEATGQCTCSTRREGHRCPTAAAGLYYSVSGRVVRDVGRGGCWRWPVVVPGRRVGLHHACSLIPVRLHQAGPSRLRATELTCRQRHQQARLGGPRSPWARPRFRAIPAAVRLYLHPVIRQSGHAHADGQQTALLRQYAQ